MTKVRDSSGEGFSGKADGMLYLQLNGETFTRWIPVFWVSRKEWISRKVSALSCLLVISNASGLAMLTGYASVEHSRVQNS